MKKKSALSLIVTLIIVSSLILVPTQQVEAISVSTSGLNGQSVSQGDTVAFTFTFTWLTGERVPLYPALELDLNNAGTWSYYNNFNLDGTINSQNPTGLISNIAVVTGPAGYGTAAWFSYGYGYAAATGGGYGYGPTGAGYSYGYNTGTGQPIQYTITLDTTNLPVGTYQVRALGYTETWPGSIGAALNRVFSNQSPISFTVTAPAGTFTVAADPTAVSVAQGSQIGSLVAATSVSGFTGTVVWSTVGALPTGVTATFDPLGAVLTSGGTGTSVLIFTASASATVGTSTVTVRGTSGATTVQTTMQLTVTTGQLGGGAPSTGGGGGGAPAAGTAPPTSAVIEANPEGAASGLLAATPADSATALLAISGEAASDAIEAMGDSDPVGTAEVLAEMASSNAAETAAIVESLVTSNPETAALVIESLVANYPSQAAAVISRMTVSVRADLIIAIFNSPNTPSQAAKALSILSTSKTTETIEELIAKGDAVTVADMFNYLSTYSLNRIFGGLSDESRAILGPYIDAETLAKIEFQYLPGVSLGTATNTVSIGAGETVTIDHNLLTGVTLQITAKTALTGSVTTEYYLSTPQGTAVKPDWLDMRRFVDVSTTIPTNQISEITMTINYGDEEMYRMVESTLSLYKYDSALNAWAPIDSTLNTAGNSISTTLTTFSLFGVGGVDP